MTGKSTSAKLLDCAHQPDYNATKRMHEANVRDWNGDANVDPMPHTYDRIDWFTHMVYRLALPDRDWNDDRPRTVFAMPDTHLVVKIHKPELAGFTADEIVDTPIARVNPMYYYFADYFMMLNRMRSYELFKTVSIVEVSNYQETGDFSQRLVAFDSPTQGWNSDLLPLERLVDGDDSLLAFLQDVNHRLG